ncbi:peptide-methionine (S)-S-oxide reductase MsrA [Bacteroidales bacterium M08MB]|nr:peptide-methionine (S)-S-oxide reductase MsrA [Perlabentimonas gracilis]
MYKFLSLTIIILLSVGSVSAQKISNKMKNNTFEIATLGAGCFWCVEAIFERVNGVEEVLSGYSGGKIANPTYREVSSGLTGHAEVVQVKFNPSVISYAKILEIFFKTHNPTMLNRQGADVGTQYRSVIFYHTDEQKSVAEDVKNMLSRAAIWNDPIVTEISPFTKFYKAEDYHQNYLENNSKQPYCQMVILPKIDKFEKLFEDYLKK